MAWQDAIIQGFLTGIGAGAGSAIGIAVYEKYFKNKVHTVLDAPKKVGEKLTNEVPPLVPEEKRTVTITPTPQPVKRTTEEKMADVKTKFGKLFDTSSAVNRSDEIVRRMLGK